MFQPYVFKMWVCAVTGDTLFGMGCGRLFEGRPEQMWKPLSKIKALPESTLVLCRHYKQT
jgi:hydroxyacylglutathione hydrolase